MESDMDKDKKQLSSPVDSKSAVQKELQKKYVDTVEEEIADVEPEEMFFDKYAALRKAIVNENISIKNGLRNQIIREQNVVRTELKDKLLDVKTDLQSEINSVRQNIIEQIEKNRKYESSYLENQISSLKKNNQEEFDLLKQSTIDQIEQYRISQSSLLDKQLVNLKNELGAIKEKYTSEHVRLIEYHSSTFSDIETEYTNKLESLVNNAKDILGDASTYVLTTSFKEEKGARFKSLRWTLGAFCTVVFLMLLVPILLFNWGNLQIELWLQNPMLFVFSLAKAISLEWPLIWVAGLLSKRMQLQQRVYEEYSYKYAAALSYSALRKDIKAMGKDCEGVANSTELKGFTERLAEAIYLNPSAVFDQKIESGSPLDGALKIIDTLGVDRAQQIFSSAIEQATKK